MTNSAGIPRALRSAKFWRCCTGDRGASLHPSVSERTTADDAWPSGLRLVPAAAQFSALACQRDIFETPVCFRGVQHAALVLALTVRWCRGPPRIDAFVVPMSFCPSFHYLRPPRLVSLRKLSFLEPFYCFVTRWNGHVYFTSREQPFFFKYSSNKKKKT